MRTLGLLGGMSWESTVTYYQGINRGISRALGGLHSAEILLSSLDFAPMEALQAAGDWEGAAADLAHRARSLEQAGAQGLLICTNTMHKVADAVSAAVDIPLLHIADATGRRCRADGAKRVGLLGTRFTMEQAFYRQHLEHEWNLEVLVPGSEEREMVHDVIYSELCLGRFLDSSRASYQEVIRGLARRGADAVVLGCTEIPMLIGEAQSPLPLYDTTALHVEQAVRWMLEPE